MLVEEPECFCTMECFTCQGGALKGNMNKKLKARHVKSNSAPPLIQVSYEGQVAGSVLEEKQDVQANSEEHAMKKPKIDVESS
jgi:hypothetical protein